MSSQGDSDVIRDLLWAMWGQLGLPSVIKWEPTPLLDVEPLIVMTAWFFHRDLRLSEEVIRWCAGNSEWVSKTRLSSLYHQIDNNWQHRFDCLAAAVHQANAKATWPGYRSSTTQALDQDALQARLAQEPAVVYSTSLGPRLSAYKDRVPLHRPGNLRLRLRALLGVGCRADVMTHLLCASLVKAGELAYLGYSKPALTTALSSLELGGFLRLSKQANAYHYELLNRSHWQALLQYHPMRFLNLRAIGNILVTWDRRQEKDNFSHRSARVADSVAATAIAGFMDELNPIRAHWEAPPWSTQRINDLTAISSWIQQWQRQPPGPMSPS